MDGFELEVHYWGYPTGKVKIANPHSGVATVIIHAYPEHMEIIEAGKGGKVYATHFLGTRPDPLLYEDEDEDEGVVCNYPDCSVPPVGVRCEEHAFLPEPEKDCCEGEPLTSTECNDCACVEAGNASYTCGRHQEWVMKRETDDCCGGDPQDSKCWCGCWRQLSGKTEPATFVDMCKRHKELAVKKEQETGISPCGCVEAGNDSFVCYIHQEMAEECCNGYPTLGTVCTTCGCNDYGFTGFYTCPRHKKFVMMPDGFRDNDECCWGEPVLNTKCNICGCESYEYNVHGLLDVNFHCARHLGWDG